MSNSKLDHNLVEAATLDEINEEHQYGVYDKVGVEECSEKTAKAPSRVGWLDINKGGEKGKEYNSRLVAQEIGGPMDKISLRPHHPWRRRGYCSVGR